MAHPLAHDVDEHLVIVVLKEAQAATRLLSSLEDSGLPLEQERAARATAIKVLNAALTEAEKAYRAVEAEGNLHSYRTP